MFVKTSFFPKLKRLSDRGLGSPSLSINDDVEERGAI
jgi:hypothetical protein